MALPAEPFAERCRRAAAAAASLGVDRLLASDHGSVRWLTGRESEIGWGPLYPISAGTHVLLDLDGHGRIFCAEGEEEAGPAIEGLGGVTYPGYTVTPLRAYSALKQLLDGGGRLAIDGHALSGPRMALVGVPPTDRRLEPGDLALADLVVRVDGYWADSCTTICLGQPTDAMRRLHDACVRALQAGFELARPGTVAGDLDQRVR